MSGIYTGARKGKGNLGSGTARKRNKAVCFVKCTVERQLDKRGVQMLGRDGADLDKVK